MNELPETVERHLAASAATDPREPYSEDSSPAPGSPEFFDGDDEPVGEGDTISFTYGIPPVRVVGPVVRIRGELWVETPGHHPDRCKMSELREAVGDFYKANDHE